MATTNSDYFPVSQKIAEFGGKEKFAESLRTALTLGADDAVTKRPIWREFEELFARTGDFIHYRPIFTNYLLDAFQTLWDDGVYYVELRDSAKGLYDLTEPQPGSTDEVIEQIIAVRAMMQARHPKPAPQFDCRLILAGYRASDAKTIVANLAEAIRLRDKYANIIVGFDLIGEEIDSAKDATRAKVGAVLARLSSSNTESDAVAVKLSTIAEERNEGSAIAAKDLPYYLHDGESARAHNENLIDAVLLGTPRIGHAFNLFRYPSLVPLIKSNNIALEICPISNQLLGLTPDLRTHPAAGYLNAGVQCTLSSDDPMYFGNDGLSYDFWEALVAWNLDLAALKKLARNSITHNASDPVSQSNLMISWSEEWHKFIQNVVTNLPNNAQQQAALPK